MPGLGPRTSIYSILTTAMQPMAQPFPACGAGKGGGEAFQWHGVKRGDAFAFYAGDIRVEGPHPFCFERRQSGDRALPHRHVHRQHRAAPRHRRRPPGQGAGRDRAGGIHHAKQWRLDHVRQIPSLTAGDTEVKSNAWYRSGGPLILHSGGWFRGAGGRLVRRFRPFADLWGVDPTIKPSMCGSAGLNRFAFARFPCVTIFDEILAN